METNRPIKNLGDIQERAKLWPSTYEESEEGTCVLGIKTKQTSHSSVLAPRPLSEAHPSAEIKTALPGHFWLCFIPVTPFESISNSGKSDTSGTGTEGGG